MLQLKIETECEQFGKVQMLGLELQLFYLGHSR